MKCPHCTVVVHVDESKCSLSIAQDATKTTVTWQALHMNCPNCQQKIIWIASYLYYNPNQVGPELSRYLVWPQSSERPVPISVPATIAADFTEAVRVLPISAQASAALTRRTLQEVLRDYGQTKAKDLFQQIDEVIAQDHLPPSLAEQLNAVRVIGNFAAHPLKSQISGAIMPVEPHEAEWNLDVLDAVFDYYFVRPALAQARKDALNKKLAEAGKPLLP